MLIPGFHQVPDGHLATVVTHLEMRAKPPLRSIPQPEGLDLVKQTAVAPDIYKQLFRTIGEDYLWFSRLHMTDDALTAIFADPKYALYTLQKNGRDLALLELDFRKGNDCELAFFGLTSELIGTGAGRYLMNQAIDLAWQQPIARFHVHTCTLDSPQALTFYMRSGFKPYNQEVEIAPDPRLTGHLSPDAAPQIPNFG